MGSAAACGEADWKGRLLPGFAADFVVLGGNPLTTDPGRIAALPVRDGFPPPMLNLSDPDPACDLDATPGVGRSLPIRAALKLSIGFGGHLAVAVLRRFEG